MDDLSSTSSGRGRGPKFYGSDQPATLSFSMMLVLVAAAAMTSAPGQLDGFNRYIGCVEAQATKLEPSGERSDLIAEVARDACAEMRLAAVLDLTRVGGGQSSPEQVEALTEAKARMLGMAMVMRARAARAKGAK